MRIIDSDIIDALAREFLRKRGKAFFVGDLLPGDDATKLGSPERPFHSLYVKNLHVGSSHGGGSGGGNADTVDGFHASSSPRANHLLALDNQGKFPTSVYDKALLKSGGTMTGNLNMASGALVDGVDVSVFHSDFARHIAQGLVAAHGAWQHNHTSDEQGGVLTQFASAEGQGTRPAYSAYRLNRKVLAGDGLMGGGTLDRDIQLSVRVGDGLQVGDHGELMLDMPGDLSAASENRSSGRHTHRVIATSDASEASLLASNASGGLRLKQFAVGSAEFGGDGDIHASGTVRGNVIVSNHNAFVENDLLVGGGLFEASRSQRAVYINKATGGGVPGALVVRSSAPNQRSLVAQGSAGQLPTSPVLAVVDSDGYERFVVRQDGSLESGSPAFVSGAKGWRISGEGDAEFRNITARGELHTSVFVANEIHATGGTMAVMPTGVVDTPKQAGDNRVGSTFNLVISGNPNTPGVCAFKKDDVLRLSLTTGLKE